ncbi:hypothetical protein [Natronoglomus mannanivorans]|uniref:Uncharacterized protein n=1 Tax=Natronoglomus mannanivorans TaxID=2979990 RepID=A0AAP3E2B0_9EURY|nr:hypothetical protein [Halobacteria archaeon AArc-xg1-1]
MTEDETDIDVDTPSDDLESEREHEREHESGSGSGSRSELEEEGTTATIDETASSFLELESEMGPTGPDPATGTGTESGASGSGHIGSEAGTETIRAQIVGAERVSSDVVPHDYPWQIKATDALALELEIREQTVTAFFAWPAEGPSDRFARLLTVLEIPPDSFASLHGERLLVTLEDGYYVPVIPSTRPRGSPAGVYGVYAGLAFTLAFAALALTGALFDLWLVVLFVLVTLLVLPVATAIDGWYLRTQTDWGQGPWFWAVLAAIPGLNVLSSLLYLRTRRRARPLHDP